MRKIELLKLGIGTIVSVGVGAVVGNAIKATTPVTIKGLEKLFVLIGGIALSGIAADTAATYSEDKIDNVVKAVDALNEDSELEDVETEENEA